MNTRSRIRVCRERVLERADELQGNDGVAITTLPRKGRVQIKILRRRNELGRKMWGGQGVYWRKRDQNRGSRVFARMRPCSKAWRTTGFFLMYILYASDVHRPIACMRSSATPLAARKVAPPERSDCPANSGGKCNQQREMNHERDGGRPSSVIQRLGSKGNRRSRDMR